MNWKIIVRLLLLSTFLVMFAGATDTWVVRYDGVGPVKIGMTLAQMNLVLHEKFSMPNEKDDQGCFFVSPSQHPQISFMIENGQVVRIDVDHPGVPTAEGIQVGDSEPHVLEVYGRRLKVEPRAYMEEDGHFLTGRSRDGRYGMRFETDHGKISGFYTGKYDAIQFIEGCE